MKCDCGATTEGNWAGIHTKDCASLTCELCKGAGFVTYRDGIAYETHDVEKEEHLIEDCPECKGTGAILE